MALPQAKIVVTGAEALIEALRGAQVSKQKIENAVKRGADITLKELETLTPLGPTGNLRRAAAIKSITYSSGTVVAVVGYRRAGSAASTSDGGGVRIGPDRAFHQYWIEEGTANRKLKNGSVASNLTSFGVGGNSYFASRAKGGKAGWAGAVVVFRPKDGELGSVTGQHPMKRAFEQTGEQAAAAIEEELAIALTAALKGASGAK
jgi:hypothetical protein